VHRREISYESKEGRLEIQKVYEITFKADALRIKLKSLGLKCKRPVKHHGAQSYYYLDTDNINKLKEYHRIQFGFQTLNNLTFIK